MADDDASGPQHAEDVGGVEPPVANLGVVRVDAAQDEPEAQPVHEGAHVVAEEARAGTEVVVGRAAGPARDRLVAHQMPDQRSGAVQARRPTNSKPLEAPEP